MLTKGMVSVPPVCDTMPGSVANTLSWGAQSEPFESASLFPLISIDYVC
jgi:hypothetical protein